MDIAQKAQYWLESVDDPFLKEDLQQLINQDHDALTDAFYKDLTFGTGGLRGVVGVGTNRMNIYTVGQATQGLANYILSLGIEHPRVAIARDSRHGGEEFVARAASVLAANGIEALLFPRVAPTPALSFAVRHLRCCAGICMTASHNPAPYNGYKAYGADGCQITSHAAEAISQEIAKTDPFTGVKATVFDDAEQSGMVQWIDDSVLDAFIDAVLSYGLEPENAKELPLSLVYTPLCGTGLECASRVFSALDITAVHLVEEQSQPNGDFPTCSYPNPEETAALEKGIALLKSTDADILLATDPDADRVGIAVKHGDEVVLPSGNEVGILLFDYICKMRQLENKMPDKPLVVSTIVSTLMLDKVAQDYGVEVKRTLTGFKYIGDIISELEEHGEDARFIFGFEESYGYLAGTHVRDKDSIIACMLICQMARYYKSLGLDLINALHQLYEKYGFFSNKTLSVAFPGEKGSRDMAKLMESLRFNTPVSIGEHRVTGFIDYKEGVGDLPAADVVELNLEGGCKVIFRPSGTEPKIKIYLFAQGTTAQSAQDVLFTLEEGARALIEHA